MRMVVAAAGTLAIAACGGAEEKRAQADQKAANFTPPTVTSRLDYGGSIGRRFRALDRDGDDVLVATELPRRNPARITSLDGNGDGRVTAIEYSEGLLARFDAMDLNHDGTLTSEERDAYRNGQRGAPTPVAPTS